MLTPSDNLFQESLDRIEHDLSFEELVILRRFAMAKAEREIELHKVNIS